MTRDETSTATRPTRAECLRSMCVDTAPHEIEATLAFHGYAIVPREPTEAMLKAPFGHGGKGFIGCEERLLFVWQAILEAAEKE